ncbi:VWA domain-containing protein [Iodobacter sp. HSC-16F04]|uniref:VWA domain-containing protein n=1 Tax=Iodobacter violaceini TaxID=3044271 RepID=A0ABX0KV13_9NEIS|nr:VWA domain-containing protein [Iodobacter violacea]NHQ84856.1 VWA domain-containing protein [Iodobacter violacea]
MSLNRVKLAAQAANDAIFASFDAQITQQSAVKQHIEQQIQRWERHTSVTLADSYPFEEYENQLNRYISQLQSEGIQDESFSTAVEDFLGFCRASKLPTNEQFWRNYTENSAEIAKDGSAEIDFTASSQLLANEWQKALDKVKAEWELKKIAELRAALLRQLKSLLDVIAQLKQLLDDLGLDAGLLFDFSSGSLSAQDIETFQRWLNYLNESDGVRQLCDLLGKLRQLEFSERLEKVLVNHAQTINVPDFNSREEIVGIRLGRDIEHALPSELALLSDPDTALLFDLKFVESRLMCFEMQGQQAEEFSHEEDRTISEQDKLGPMVICVDTSGSMRGMPETIAKAVTLFMACKAKEQGRACYVINFSTGIKCLDLGLGIEMDSLIDFLRMSFHGGTDVAPALDHALTVMKEDNYQKADLLMISDFVMGGLPQAVQQQIEAQRAFGNQFYSLVVGSTFMSERLATLFDHEWIFDPHSSQIHELISFKERMSEQRVPV